MYVLVKNAGFSGCKVMTEDGKAVLKLWRREISVETLERTVRAC
jgi:hypothetical protein